MNVLIYGFGRMGLTHFTILNSITSEIKFTVVEPNNKYRYILKKNLNLNFIKEDRMLNKSFDLTLITTPPFLHLQILDKCLERGDKKIFVEKPFGGYTNNQIMNFDSYKNVYIGYVLRYNPCIQWIKSKIKIEEISSISGEYLSNTIEKKPKGWRNGPFSGVINEVGSHIIDLVCYLINATDMTVIDAEKKSIHSDVDDIVKSTLKTNNNISVKLFFNWVNKKIRKPIFKIKVDTEDGSTYVVDQQQIERFNSENKLVDKISVTDISETVPYYLRGIDFTKQMIDLIGSNKHMANVRDAVLVNNIISKIINHEDNSR